MKTKAQKITVNTTLLSVNADAKTTKGAKLGYLTGILYLAPSNLSGRNVCAHASAGCKAACLFTAGRGKMKNVSDARIRKTNRFYSDPKAFVELLAQDIAKISTKAFKLNMVPAIRLNGTSDLPWESLRGNQKISLMDRFPDVQFYDYTKNPNRALAHAAGRMPSNYHLTFSRSECNHDDVDRVLSAGGNVAAVFDTGRKGTLPVVTSNGIDIIDGDASDLRFTDRKHAKGAPGSYVGLRAKGDAIGDTSGFVINVASM